MKIAVLSSADRGGGAEKVVYRLWKAYQAKGCESVLVVGFCRVQEGNIVVLRRTERLFGRAISAVLRRVVYPLLCGLDARWQWWRGPFTVEAVLSQILGLEVFDYCGYKELRRALPFTPDIFHLHNLHGWWLPERGYFDLRSLPRLSRRFPVVVTLHDMWLLTGHCAHSFDCERWQRGCGSCPYLDVYVPLRRDASHYNWKRKKSIYKRCRLWVAVPSRWLMDKVVRSVLGRAIVEARVIPYGVPCDVFSPLPAEQRLAERRKLNIDEMALVIAYVGMHFRDNPWKDWHTAEQAVIEVARYLAPRQVVLLAMGEKGSVERPLENLTILSCCFEEEERVARALACADVYLHSARADTFPNAVLEAQACGLPVVATAVGGVPEQIICGETGFLTPPQGASQMAEALLRLLVDSELRRRMGICAREHALCHYTMERHVNNYLRWFEEIVERWKKERSRC